MRSFPALPPGDDADAHSCTIWYIRRRLGRTDYSGARMVTYVGALIDGHGFPRPFPHMKRAELVDGVSMHSSWPRAAVDQWLNDFMPPEGRAAIDAQARREAAETLDARAAQLQLGTARPAARNLAIIDGGRA